MPFSSTSIEGLMLNKSSIYLDNLKLFPNNSYQKIKNFVFTDKNKIRKKFYYLCNSKKNLELVKKEIFGESLPSESSNQLIINQILNEK